jgi:uncharacterized protein (TIGR02145 family)
MAMSGGKIGFINQKGEYIVSPLYEIDFTEPSDFYYTFDFHYATWQNSFNSAYAYEGIKENIKVFLKEIVEKMPWRLRQQYLAYFNDLLNFKPYEAFEAKKKAWVESKKVSFSDPRDGKKYKSVKIGGLIWMAENLNYEAEDSKCYGNNAENCDKYGRLYNWSTAVNVCPSGWRLPGNADWDKLFRAADGTGGKESPYKSATAGWYLKAKSGWLNNGNGDDAQGFAALPGGGGYAKGSFFDAGYSGYWWNATESEENPNSSYRNRIDSGNNNAYWQISTKSNLFSVRCVKD